MWAYPLHMRACISVHIAMATFVLFGLYVTGLSAGGTWQEGLVLLAKQIADVINNLCRWFCLAANHNYGGGNPMRPHRVRLTHSLVSNYGLNSKMYVHRPQARSKEQIEEFHCDGEPHCHVPPHLPVLKCMTCFL